MPLLSRCLIRLALLHLVVGFGLGSAALASSGTPWAAAGRRLLSSHAHLVLVGFMLQLTLGVASWILPRLPVAGRERGREALGWAALAALNGGVVMAAAASATAAPRLLPAGAFLQLAAVLLGVPWLWPRVRRLSPLPPAS